MFDAAASLAEVAAEALAKAVPALLPAMALRACMRAGLDSPVLAEPGGFDRIHYERMAGRKFASDEDALYHYLQVGSRRGLEPRSGFSPDDYRRRNPDIAFAGYEPFAHYLRFGRKEGRGATAHVDRPDDSLLAPPSVWRMLERPRPNSTAAKVDVVIPVYGSRALTLRTIDSVLAEEVRTRYELVIVDDASADRQLRGDLESLAREGLATLLTNERNSGFVESVNRGLALHADRDVILLNSDTQVFAGWLDRLVAVLHSAPQVATVTPLSNAATIVSYPVTLRDNYRPLNIDLAALDQLCARLGEPAVEIPTAVGFCMAIKRACLDETGLFDAARFGRGYGEENDFCLRASAAGWRHVAATDVFVWHRGAGSFGDQREAHIAAALATLEQLHPGYGRSIRRFIGRDPLQTVRARLDAARLLADPRRKILHVGTADRLAEEGDSQPLTLALTPDIGPFFSHYRMSPISDVGFPNLSRIERSTPPATLAQMMRGAGIQELWLNSRGGIPEPILRSFATAAKNAEISIRNG